MGAGLFLVVLGALLTFAVKDEMPNVNLGVAGLILMIAGGAVIAHARTGTTKERVVTTREDSDDPAARPHVVEEITRERRHD